ncbi:Proton-dependent oligopeptide transporter family [Trema orientale]|uniref:Proton-dependent oligopeptide transporter family n=1 Tax=Trema orientale TaxID=63057 RepID=A0A2P5EKJ7_TREOI|nr:Proton-dependent oligopeptide transporter family [Trema orientale]
MVENEEKYHPSSSTDQYSAIPSPPSPASSSPGGKKPGGWRSIKYILGNESFEKLASMSLIANITVYLSTKYNLSGIFLVTVVNVWSGFSNISSLAGAFVSDAYLGKFYTLLCGSIASLLGMGIMTLTAGINLFRPAYCDQESSANCPKPLGWQLGILFAGLGLLSIGAGGIRPCNIAFGADQFDTRTEKGKAQLESFFNWWYFCFTIALVVALTGVVYIQTNVSWTLGFAIPTACLGLSITIFLLGHHTYINVKPQGSVFSDILKVITAACRKRSLSLGPEQNEEHTFYDPPLTGSELKLPRTHRFRCLDKAAIITSPDELNNQGMPKDGWRLCSLQQVEQLKSLIAVLPVGVTGVGAFITMDQNNTFGVLQAMQMDRAIGPHFMFPPGWMNIVSMVALSIWIYIYEKIYIPQTRKMTGRDKRLTMRQRIRIGIVMSILSMVVSGIVERHRRNSASKQASFISPASIALLFPQFCLSGLTEAFAAVAIMEFLTMQLTESMRTVAGAIFFLCLSISSYVGSVIVNIIHALTEKTSKSPWLGGHDLNKNRLDYYYYMMAGLAALNLIYFSFFATHYVLNSNPESEQREDDHIACHSRNNSECIQMDEEKGLAIHEHK